jgi:Xaa-Pro aminopeptidase
MRLQKLRALMREKGLEAVLVDSPKNRRYFSGFSGSAGMLLVTLDKEQIFTDFRYFEQVKIESPQFELIELESGLELYNSIAQTVKDNGMAKGGKIGFEGEYMTFNIFKRIAEKLPEYEFVPVSLDSCRMVKDEGELALIKKAVEIADSAFSRILSYIKPGLREIDVALELEYQMRKLGAEKSAFDTIAASGIRGALPHGVASAKVLAAGDFLTLDFGAVYQGYHSDMTRTVVLGKADAKQREIYELVLAAQLTGLEALQAGKTGKEVDAAARLVIEKAGYGKCFGHGLGHSVGLAIHEAPSLSPKGEVKLEAGMTLTVEPGIYLPGWGGVRIEDLAVVLPDGREILTQSSKKLIEIG